MIPETIKVARASITTTAALQYESVPINPGVDEVAIIRAIEWQSFFIKEADDIQFGWLWRRSKPATVPNIETNWVRNNDVLDNFYDSMVWSTAVGWAHVYNRHYKLLPAPIVLLRSPQLVALSSAASGGAINVSLWYQIQTLADKELAKLMVKDHE